MANLFTELPKEFQNHALCKCGEVYEFPEEIWTYTYWLKVSKSIIFNGHVTRHVNIAGNKVIICCGDSLTKMFACKGTVQLT
jgi:CDGSH-type Zn-finger protein